MATRNYSFIVAGDDEIHGAPGTRLARRDLPDKAFPFNNEGRTELGGHDYELADDYLWNHKEEMRHLVNNAIAGTLAFLVGAGESMLPDSCGDGMARLGNGETCDDKNRVSGDGCSEKCQEESGFSCNNTRAPSICSEGCGDRWVDYEDGEACDDGGLKSGDGCGVTCDIERGWTCRSQDGLASKCFTTCGDGIVAGSEQCDAGEKNGMPAAKCSKTRQRE
jgi:cysteine-rich repeat protein